MSFPQQAEEKQNQVPFSIAGQFKLTDILERISEGFVALDNNWCYTYMNKKAGEIFNRDPIAMIGKHIWTEFPEGVDQPFYKAYYKAMDEQHYIHIEEYYEPYCLWFENDIYPSPQGLSIFFRDITEKKKAAEAAMESTRHYQTLTEISPVGIFHTDATGYTTYVNRRWCQISGMSYDEALGNGWFNAVHKDDREKLSRDWQEATKVEEISISEYRFVRPDGSIAWVMGQATPARNLENQIVGYVGTTTDITGRKKAEEALNQNRIFIEGIINASPDIIYIYDIEERKNIYVNEGIQQNLGYTDDEIKQMGDQVLPVLMNPGDLKDYFQNISPKYSTLKDKEIVTHEIRLRDKNHNWHWFYCKESVFLRNDNGSPKQIFGICSNITEQKKIENEILKEKYLSDSIINSLPGIFYVFDANGKYLRWNKNFETISGYSFEEVEAMHPLDFFCEEEKGLLKQKISEVFETGMAEVEARFYTKGQQKLNYYFNGWKVLLENKPCLIGVGLDISEFKHTEEELHQTTQRLRKLTTYLQNIRDEERKRIGREIHDELGQQLTAIKMDVAWIDKKTPKESAPIKTKLSNIMTLLNNGNVSVRKILSELRADILDNDGLKDALEWHAHQFTDNTDIPLLFECDDIGIPLEEPVSNCLFRVFQEALTNITKYAKAQHVFSSLQFKGNKIILQIKDDGKGFNTALLKNNQTFGILGIQERVTSLNGKFDLVSSPGKGTEITITLPV